MSVCVSVFGVGENIIKQRTVVVSNIIPPRYADNGLFVKNLLYFSCIKQKVNCKDTCILLKQLLEIKFIQCFSILMNKYHLYYNIIT